MYHRVSTVLSHPLHTATTKIYPLSLHDALPISPTALPANEILPAGAQHFGGRIAWFTVLRQALSSDQLRQVTVNQDRKSTRLNSSHGYISYAVLCLKKKINITYLTRGSIRRIVG